MKKYITIFTFTLSSFAQNVTFNGPVIAPIVTADYVSLNYANTNSGALVCIRPTIITNADSSVNFSPTESDYSNACWRLIQSISFPSSGLYASASYIIEDIGNGKCNVIATNSLNLYVNSDATITNSIYWTPDFVITLQQYRSIMRAYQGPSGETNIVNAVTISKFLGQNPTWYAGTNASNMTLEFITANNVLTYYPWYTNTMQWWQKNGHLVP